VEIDTNLAFQIERPGVYRIDTNPNTNETYVTVRNGEGQVTSNTGAFPVHMREQAIVTGQDQQVQYNVYQAPGFDEFDTWATSRDRREVRGPSARYVLVDGGYEDLDEYGSWRNVRSMVVLGAPPRGGRSVALSQRSLGMGRSVGMELA
jgi:hypothetical protein